MKDPYGGHAALTVGVAFAIIATGFWIIALAKEPTEPLDVLVFVSAGIMSVATLVALAFSYSNWVPKRYREMDRSITNDRHALAPDRRYEGL